MDGIQARAQSAVQGMTAKEISNTAEDFVEDIGKIGGNIIGATVAALLPKNPIKRNKHQQI